MNDPSFGVWFYQVHFVSLTASNLSGCAEWHFDCEGLNTIDRSAGGINTVSRIQDVGQRENNRRTDPKSNFATKMLP